MGYCQRRIGHKGTRGYVVFMTQDLDNQRKTAAREAIPADDTDGTDDVF